MATEEITEDGTKIIDHREPEVVIDNTSRQAQRQFIRREIAESEALAGKIAILRERLKLVDAEADQATDDHQATCLPLQSELRETEEAIVAAMAARKPVDPVLEDRRREIMADIEVANEVLSDAVARVDRLRKPLAQEIRALEKQYTPRQILEMKLNREGLANPDLLDRQWVLDECSKLLANAIAAANKRIGQLGPERVRNASKYERRYAMLADMLTTMNTQVRSELNEVHQATINE